MFIFSNFCCFFEEFFKNKCSWKILPKIFFGKTDICGREKFFRTSNYCLEWNKICSSRWNFNNDMAKMWYNYLNWIANNENKTHDKLILWYTRSIVILSKELKILVYIKKYRFSCNYFNLDLYSWLHKEFFYWKMHFHFKLLLP